MEMYRFIKIVEKLLYKMYPLRPIVISVDADRLVVIIARVYLILKIKLILNLWNIEFNILNVIHLYNDDLY